MPLLASPTLLQAPYKATVQVWGPLVFESRRFVELRQKSLWKQVCSAESTGMGLFYTLNIFCIQVRLDPTRLSPSKLKNDYSMIYRELIQLTEV